MKKRDLFKVWFASKESPIWWMYTGDMSSFCLCSEALHSEQNSHQKRQYMYIFVLKCLTLFGWVKFNKFSTFKTYFVHFAVSATTK